MHEPRKVLVPELQPGCCSRCMSAPGENREFFIDPGFNTFDGVVYFCDRCISDIVQVDGRFISVEEHEAKRREWISTLEAYNEMRVKYDKLFIELGEVLGRAADHSAPDGNKQQAAFSFGSFDSSKTDAPVFG